MSKRKVKSEWRKDHAGRYVSDVSGWVIERSEDSPRWNVVNPVTGGIFDSVESLRQGKQGYSNIGEGEAES